jgi:hypothetical protein
MTLRCWAPPMVDCFQVCCVRRDWSTPTRAGHPTRCSRPLKSLWRLKVLYVRSGVTKFCTPIGRLADALRERLAEGDLAEVLLSDLILTGRLPTPGQPQAIWVVLEVSTTVDRRDVERAQRRAALLRQARYPAVAVAGGTEATAGARQAASETGVALLLDGRIDGWQEAVDHMLAEGEAGPP